MLMVYLHNKFRMLGCNNSLIIATKREAKHVFFRAAAMLLLHILQKLSS